jgi:hypothetical protein
MEAQLHAAATNTQRTNQGANAAHSRDITSPPQAPLNQTALHSLNSAALCQRCVSSSIACSTRHTPQLNSAGQQLGQTETMMHTQRGWMPLLCHMQQDMLNADATNASVQQFYSLQPTIQWTQKVPQY